jgi:hypothetical protein
MLALTKAMYGFFFLSLRRLPLAAVISEESCAQADKREFRGRNVSQRRTGVGPNIGVLFVPFRPAPFRPFERCSQAWYTRAGRNIKAKSGLVSLRPRGDKGKGYRSLLFLQVDCDTGRKLRWHSPSKCVRYHTILCVVPHLPENAYIKYA